jgi:hypothetical protein
VAFFSAIIGVVLTAFAISIQLSQQSDAEAQKDKDVKIFEQKVKIYSEFTSKIWKMADDVESNPKELDKKYNELRIMCFDKLVFFLSPGEIEQLAKVIGEIDTKKPFDHNLSHLCKITNILQSSLEIKHEKESYLTDLYKAFDRKDIDIKEATKQIDGSINNSNITFWHFNLFGDDQIEAFKKGNWCLSLIE